jgi:hypothetical protein
MSLQHLDISTQYSYPEESLPFPEQVRQLLSQYSNPDRKNLPVKMTFFACCQDPNEFTDKYNVIQLEKQRNNIIAPIALVSQAPFGVSSPLLEVHIIHNLPSETKYSIADNCLIMRFGHSEILFASTGTCQHKYFDENVEAGFEMLSQLLNRHSFKYANILRQWNYIGGILKTDPQRDGINQHYQVFNNYRSIHYSGNTFTQGYPAATGIGTSLNACCMEVIALRGDCFSITALHNNRQVNAYNYSEKVLAGYPLRRPNLNPCPKFERALFLHSPSLSLLLISGTASIIGENTVCPDDVVGQTHTALNNIQVLLDQTQSQTGKSGKVLNYRAYVKRPGDCETVRSICERHYGVDKGAILIADICRDDLLVEIECNYIF